MSDVSRETSRAPAHPFPEERLHLARRYAELLGTTGVERGLIGPREVARIWDRHLLNCALIAAIVPAGATVIDVGSGAGLPGLVLAIARPDLRVTLLEPLLRRTTFLEETVDALGLTGVRVVRGRAEEGASEEERFDVVTARAVAPLARLLGWTMPLVAPRGELVAMKGRTAATEVEEAATVLDRLHCAPPRIEVLGDGDPLSTATVVRVAHAEPARVS